MKRNQNLIKTYSTGSRRSTLSRIARGQLGQRILKIEVKDKFEMFGEDNVLLRQINPYSVVSVTQNAIIATANTQHLFKLLSEGGSDFINELRQCTKDKFEARFKGYVVDHMKK
jgi:hypothetical protein